MREEPPGGRCLPLLDYRNKGIVGYKVGLYRDKGTEHGNYYIGKIGV